MINRLHWWLFRYVPASRRFWPIRHRPKPGLLFVSGRSLRRMQLGGLNDMLDEMALVREPGLAVPFTVDRRVPPGEVHVVQDGRIVGRITGLTNE